MSSKRLGREGDPSKPDVRSEFQRDFDRIVYSSAFRRMQDKTQVFPLAESDYVRTRLTHSIEVSSVGRSLGTLAGDFVGSRGETTRAPAEFGNVVAAACLAHDIGNPPFGHSGEQAIRSWFERREEAYFGEISDEQQADFRKFEGNAQGFRLLTRLQSPSNDGGLQLTYATLGAFSKYPRKSLVTGLVDSKRVSEKKFGFCVADRDSFAKVAAELGLIATVEDAWSRHPLAFLTEAADDICYRIVDLEDGHRVGRVSFEEVEALLKPVAFAADVDDLAKRYAQLADERERVEYLRARAINSMINEVVAVFSANYDEIMAGTFEYDLVSRCKLASEVADIRKVSFEKIYQAAHVVQIEAAGFEVLGGLLDKFVPALMAEPTRVSAAEAKLLQLVPRQYKSRPTAYERLLAATDFVSGMTDSFALTLFRRVHGIELPRS